MVTSQESKTGCVLWVGGMTVLSALSITVILAIHGLLCVCVCDRGLRAILRVSWRNHEEEGDNDTLWFWQTFLFS